MKWLSYNTHYAPLWLNSYEVNQILTFLEYLQISIHISKVTHGCLKVAPANTMYLKFPRAIVNLLKTNCEPAEVFKSYAVKSARLSQGCPKVALSKYESHTLRVCSQANKVIILFPTAFKYVIITS